MDDPVEDLRPATRYLLPDELRDELAGDFGPIVPDDELAATLESAGTVIAVGDIVSMDLQKRGIQPRAFVCDYKTHRDDENPEFRESLSSWGDREVTVMNPAGTITRKAWSAIRDVMDRDDTTRIVVNGEEDLLGIPAFLESPIGAKVVYGSPGRGAVVVEVTTTLQKRVRDLVARFEEE